MASTSDLSRTAPATPPKHHPDLSNEVATLSDKLIQAINNQTVLDDTLAETRQELEGAKSRLRQLEEENRRYREEVSAGILLRKDDVDVARTKLEKELDDERTKRIVVEKEKKSIEQELETLTAALFEEANKMVAAAKQEREVVEQRNKQLHSQILDTEALLASHQEQLAELKSVMQHMNVDREESESQTDPSTAPTSPGTQQQDGINRLMEAMNLSPTTPGSGDISPAPSTSFSHLIKSVCRTDITAYEDFHALLQMSSTSKPPSRVGSGSYSGLNVLGLGSLAASYNSPQHQHHSSAPAPSTPSQLSPSSSSSNSPHLPLKETRFYKRVLTEDIEPTLRLDTAPGISWLTRRSVLSSICDGGLVVEPTPAIVLKYPLPCSLCGERRNGGENSRTHRFRTSDSETAQRHPLCILCLEKMRACCEFIGYLRMIVEGHIRISDEDDEKDAWEETIRLRERMFWSRMGGGVVPAFIQTSPSEQDDTEQICDSPQPKRRSGTVTANGPNLPEERRTGAEVAQNGDTLEDPFVSKAIRASIGGAVISKDSSPETSQHEDVNRKDSSNDEASSSSHIAASGMVELGDIEVKDVTLTEKEVVVTPEIDGDTVPPAVPIKPGSGTEPKLKVTIPSP